VPGILDRVDAYGAHPDQWVRLRGDTSATLCMCFIHGGYWRSTYTARLMEPLMVRMGRDGVAAVNIEYRRERDAAAMQADVRAALRRAREVFPHARRAVVGHSAGGHLALITTDEAELIVALAAVTDLAGGYAAQSGSGAVAELMGASPAERPAAYDAATPRPSTVPTLLVHGADDDRVPVSHSQDFAHRARTAGAPLDAFEFAHLDHMVLIDPDGPHWPSVWAWVHQRVDATRRGSS